MTDIMTNTPHLGLPFIEGSQAQKHVPHNEALRKLDALVMLAAIDRDLAAPPDEPADGARYIVKAPGSGAFAGKGDQVAVYDGGAWLFYAPRAGWTCYVEDEGALLTFDGAAWQVATGAELQNLSLLGIGTTADAVNPLAAKLNNVLWTARTQAEGGDGDLRYKLSKESAAKTVSLLLQDDYSGRAELGLTGDDDFHVKVSPDGSSWTEAITVARANGKVSFPAGTTGLRPMLTAPRTYYVRPDGNDTNDGLSDTAGGAFLTIQKAVDVVFGTLDLGGFDVTIQLADGSYSAGVAVRSPQVGAGLVTIQGNASHPENVIIANSSLAVFGVIEVVNGATLHIQDVQIQSTQRSGLLTRANGTISFSGIRFGAVQSYHMYADDQGYIRCEGNYAIVGGGMGHMGAGGGAGLRCQNKTVTLIGTPNFSTVFAEAAINGFLIVNGNTYSGSATGKRYQANQSGTILTNGAGATYLPGSVAGTTASGGQYV